MTSSVQSRFAFIGFAMIAGLVACGSESSSSTMATTQEQPVPPAPVEAQRNFPPKPQLPVMELQAQYQGPFEDTIIQRWRDPIDGRICYLYIPAQVTRDRREDSPFLDYGSNSLGSISCMAPVVAIPVQPQQAPDPQAGQDNPPPQE